MVEMIATDGLVKQFGAKRVVDGISLSVGKGEVLGFLGPNGAGKSTTMRMITGFLRPSEGSARICGFDVQDKPIEARRHLGYLPEGAPLYSDMTPLGFLRFIADMRGLTGADKSKAVDRAVALADLRSVLPQPIETLSKGFKRRVGLAQALLHDPDVLVLDEPTDGLDPNQKHEVRKLIAEISPTKAIIISTHILEEVEAVCSRAVVIGRGKLIADGTPAELAARSPRHGAVSFEIGRDQAAHAATVLDDLPQVAAVQRDEEADRVRLVVLPKPGAALFGPVSALIERENWMVAHLRAETGHLDEVFRSLTAPSSVIVTPPPAAGREKVDA